MTNLRLTGKEFPTAAGPGACRARRARRGLLRALSAGGLLLLAACTYRGDLETPFAQKLTWFSLLNGDDIRSACHEGAPDRLRLVYNGRYQEQLRVYDLVASDPAGPNAGGAELLARVQDADSYNRLGSIDLGSPLSAWQWREARASLSEEEFRRLQRTLEQAGLGEPTPAGTELLSTRFYWIAIACAGGRVWFQAWQHPASDVTRLPFVSLLLAADGTGVPFNAPRPLGADEVALQDPGPLKERERGGFRMVVTENGLGGLP